MAPNRKTRKVRRGGGWFGKSRNANLKGSAANVQTAATKAMQSVDGEAKDGVKSKAQVAVSQRSDYKKIDQKIEKLITERRNALEELEKLEKEKKNLLNQEIRKEANLWVEGEEKRKKQKERKGWFS
jgi:low affinity Fe/Cu permease